MKDGVRLARLDGLPTDGLPTTIELHAQTLMKGTRYATRLPIGKMDVIQNAKPATARGFYQTWYHPRRMAILCVGDFSTHAGGADKVLDRPIGKLISQMRACIVCFVLVSVCVCCSWVLLHI